MKFFKKRSVAVVVLVLALLAVKVGSELLFPSFWS